MRTLLPARILLLSRGGTTSSTLKEWHSTSDERTDGSKATNNNVLQSYDGGGQGHCLSEEKTEPAPEQSVQ
jgi:hypothetical protein